MTEDAPVTPPAPDTAQPQPSPSSSIPFDISQEFGTAQRNLPPAKIVGIALACVLVIVAICALTHRAKPQGGGSIDNIVSIEVPNQNQVMTAINISLRNTGEKPMWIHDIKATLKTDSGEFGDESAAAVDFNRYFQAFPSLKEHALSPITPETKIPVGGGTQGTVIFSFPVNQDAFDKRKSLTVAIQPYDQPLPIVLSR